VAAIVSIKLYWQPGNPRIALVLPPLHGNPLHLSSPSASTCWLIPKIRIATLAFLAAVTAAANPEEELQKISAQAWTNATLELPIRFWIAWSGVTICDGIPW